jgi:hypothetical protein
VTFLIHYLLLPNIPQNIFHEDGVSSCEPSRNELKDSCCYLLAALVSRPGNKLFNRIIKLLIFFI